MNMNYRNRGVVFVVRGVLPVLLALLCVGLRAADVRFYYITKSQSWAQTGPADLSRTSGDKYVFNARCIENVLGSVGSGNLTLPSAQELPFGRFDDGSFGISWTTDNDIGISGFNLQWPSGDYVMRMSTLHDGTYTPTLTLTSDGYPNIPQVSNFTSAQSIDPTKDFTLQWFPFQGGRTLDYIRFEIYTSTGSSIPVFVSGYPGDPNALNGLSTSIVIPANTLIPGATYRGHIWFARVADYDATSYPGAIGYAGYGQNLFFAMKTVGTPIIPTVSSQPQSQSVLAGSTANFSVSASGPGQLSYQWISSADSFDYWNLNGPTLTLTNVQATNAGNYWVVVSNPAGSVTSQIAVLTVTNPPPSAPMASAASGVSGTGFTANWTISSGATGYRLDVSTSSAFSSYVNGYLNLDLGNVASQTVSGISAGTTYYYRVRAYNGVGTSVSSGTISVTTLPVVPLANAASNVTTNGFSANWTTSSGATGYQLDVSTSSTFSSYVSGYANLSLSTVTNHTVSGLNAGTVYYYRVRAYSSVGASGNSGTISVTTLGPPPAPTASAASGITSAGFTANWLSSVGATSYRLDVSRYSAFSPAYSTLDVGNVTSYAVAWLVPNTTYYYRVRAYNGFGASSNSATISVTTSLSAPTLYYSRQASNLVLSWPTNVTGFTLEFATNFPASAWAPHPNSPLILNGQFMITDIMDTVDGGHRFYRLKH
jgi:hypothetical protein